MAGAIPAALVYIGDYFRWPNFNRRSGYFGTEFMDSFLYALNDPVAIHIVAFVWFLYLSVPLFLLGLALNSIRE